MRAPKDVMEETPKLIRLLYLAHNSQTGEGYVFDKATHPMEVLMWHWACEARAAIAKAGDWVYEWF